MDNPRLKSSTQWSPFPAELCELTAAVLTERFSEEYDTEGAVFAVEGFIFQEEIIGRYGLRLQGQIKQYNFEVSMDYDAEKDKPLELIQNSMDVVDHLWTELFEDDLEDSELPTVWQTMPYEKRMYHFRYSTVNTELEKEADRLLNEYEKKLVYQADSHDPAEDMPEDDSSIH